MIVHAITPGDHFSPSTGSAIPTVVHGIAGAARAAGAPAHAVVVARGTYPDRYPSAVPVEYDARPRPTSWQRAVDLTVGRLSPARAGRPFLRRHLAPLVAAQASWPPSTVLAHNLPGLVPLVEGPHTAVLYAHNDLLRTYPRAEAGRALARVSAVVCVSDHLAERTRHRLPRGLRDRVVTVHHGVDGDVFFPAGRPVGEPRPDGRVRLAFVGRVVPEKGPDVLLDAVGLLGRDDVRVAVIGSAGFDPAAPLTAYETRLRQVARRSRAWVEFRPFVDRRALPALLREQDVVVVPSRWAEPSTLTVPEAQATGLPVVASRVGGIPEVAAVPELLVPPDDPPALAEALAGLLDDPPRRAEVGARGRAYALRNGWAETWRTLERVLAERS